MKRIDTINVREDLFGSGKAGFHDNADLSGQDATYLSPDWLNSIQEELCNILELSGVALNPESKRQLFDLLLTRKNLVNDLTTGGTGKALTAEQGKLFFGMFSGGNYHFKIPNPLLPSKPWIVQFGSVTKTAPPGTSTHTLYFNLAFPNACSIAICSGESHVDVTSTLESPNKSQANLFLHNFGTSSVEKKTVWVAIGN